MDVFCQCGCGEITPLAKRMNMKRGTVRGMPMLYVGRGWTQSLEHWWEK